MIVLDTDVLSALMRWEANPSVIDWINRQDPAHLWLTVISIHEVAFGIERMPAGKRKSGLEGRFGVVLSRLGHRVLHLDSEAAKRAARCRALAERTLGYCDVPDCLIAGIASAQGASVATRNVSHFEHFGVPLVNPWTTFGSG